MEASNRQLVISSEESFLLSIYSSLWRNRCLSVIIGLKIPDIICSAETSISIEAIAAKSGCDSTKQLYPMMRLLAQLGIGIELENKHFAKNKTLELLRRDQGPSLGHIFEYMNGEECYTGLRSLAACVKHGKPAFVLEHGMTHIQYLSDIEKCPYNVEKMYEGASKHKIGSDERRRELAENYSSGLKYITNLVNLSNVPGVNNLFKAFPWSECKKIVDIGGSTGDFLASILKLPGCEHIQGYVIELGEVVTEARRKVQDLGIEGHRIEFIQQDCLRPFPNELHLQADTVTMKNMFNQFTNDPEKMTKILTNCRGLFSAEGGRILVIDYVTPDSGDTEHNIGINGLDITEKIIHWLNICGTHVLSRNEWLEVFNNEICNDLGYHLHKIHDTFHGGATIFELRYNPIETSAYLK